MAGNFMSKSKNDSGNTLEKPGLCRYIHHSQKTFAINNSWISRESPEGGCVIINDTSSQTRLLEEILKQKRTVTAYEGYLVNEEDNLEPLDWDGGKCKSEENYPIEIVELPEEPDGKHIDIHFVKEGSFDEATQTPSIKPDDIDCGVSVRSMSSDRQHWSFSLYNFEDNGRISKEDLTNLVRSIYDALGKSVGKANKKNSHEPVKKVKVHISVSKEKEGKEMRRAAVVPRREVLVGAEQGTTETEKQLEQLQLKEFSQEAPTRRSKRRNEKEERYSTVHVLNNDLGKVHLHSAGCKSCWPVEDKNDKTRRSSGNAQKNNNLLADRPNYPARRHTGPGVVPAEHKMAVCAEDLAKLTEKKSRGRSQRRSSRRRPTYPGHASPGPCVSGNSSSGHSSPVAHVSGYSSPVGHISGYTSPVAHKDVPLDPSYAYHTEDKYLYVHAAPRQTPLEEPNSSRRRKYKHRRPRDECDNPEMVTVKYSGGSSVVHRHEHVHHHYHHYGERR